MDTTSTNNTEDKFTAEMFSKRWNQSPTVKAGRTRETVTDMPREIALTMPFVEANALFAPNIISVDLKHDTDIRSFVSQLMADGTIPDFSYAVFHPDNTEGTLYYLVAGDAESRAAREFFNRVQEGFTISLTEFGSDINRSLFLIRNPLFGKFNVVFGTATPIELKYLKTFVSKEALRTLWEQKHEHKLVADSLDPSGDLFHAARRWAYRAYRSSNGDLDQFSNDLLAHLSELNEQFEGKKLNVSELSNLASSMITFCIKFITEDVSPEFRKKQQFRQAQREVIKNRESDIKAVLGLLDAGYGLKDVTRIQGITRGAAKSRIWRARNWRAEQQGQVTPEQAVTTSIHEEPAVATLRAATTPAPKRVTPAEPPLPKLPANTPTPRAYRGEQSYSSEPFVATELDDANRLLTGTTSDGIVVQSNVYDNTAEMNAARRSDIDYDAPSQHPTEIQGYMG